MKLTEVHDLVILSSTEDWRVINCFDSASGPSYRDSWDKFEGQDGWELVHGRHSMVATYRPDVALTIAWGLTTRIDQQPRRQPEWLQKFHSTKPVVGKFADVFWNGALIDRVEYETVDNTYLPNAEPVYANSSAIDDAELTGYEVARFDYELVRLIHILSGNSVAANYEDDFERAGFTVVD